MAHFLFITILTVIFQISLNARADVEEYSAQWVDPIVKDANHPMSPLLRALGPRMFRTEKASGTVVGMNGQGQGLLFSAFHVNVGGDQVSTPTDDKFVSTLKFQGFAVEPAPGSGRPLRIRTPSDNPVELAGWVIFQPTVEFKNHILSGYDLNLIQPESDFFVAAVDSDLKMETLQIRSARDGEQVVILGFPEENGGRLSFSTGKIVSDNEAKKTRTGKGDNSVQFRPGVEKMIRGYASPGFSGGGIFGLDGNFLGVISRGVPVSAEKKGTIRFVTSPFIMSQIQAASSQNENKGFARYIGKGLWSASAEPLRCQKAFL